MASPRSAAGVGVRDAPQACTAALAAKLGFTEGGAVRGFRRRARRGALTTVVLVHGLYHGPEHFAVLSGRLAVIEIETVVPELHRGSLLADPAEVQAAIDSLREPPIVVGHSYGGSVITGVRGARHLVYLAAFVPDGGESASGLGGASPQLRRAIIAGAMNSTSLRPDRASATLYGDCPEPLASWAAGLLRGQAPGCGRGVPERNSWMHVPSTYVVCAQDRAIDPGLQRRLASRCTDVREWETGHSPFVGRPGLIVELLEELLGDVIHRRRGSPTAGPILQDFLA